MNVNELPDHIRRLNPHLFPRRSANLEPRPATLRPREMPAEKAHPRNHGRRAEIEIIEYRHRLHDPGGGCSKWIIDALVVGGLLPDDSAAFIEEPRHRQVKIGRDEAERTEVVIR